MRMVCWCLLILCGPALAGPAGWLGDQRFSTYSEWAAKQVFVTRVLLPTEADRFLRAEQRSVRPVAEHSVDLAAERFDVYLPRQRPEAGYGLLVFVPPADDFPLSREWLGELDRRGIIYVAARRSGNQHNVLDRRMPLALHAHAEILSRYEVDPERVYVGGFSGGSRVAQRLALAFPDLFRGALLVASSDPLGVLRSAPPSVELMALFDARTRVVFATGGLDMPNRRRDERTRASLAEACVANISTIWVARTGHWLPPRRAFAKAMAALEAPPQSSAEHAACVRGRQQAIERELDRIESLLHSDPVAAGEALGRLEDRVGGLAAPRSLILARSIADHLAQEPTAHD